MIKRSLLAFSCLLVFSSIGCAQSVTLNLDAGALLNSTGLSGEPSGGLLQLIASPSGTFSAPTSASYVSGDNVLVSNFAMNYVGGPNELSYTLNSLPLSTAKYTLTTGESLLLRFYPSLTLASEPNTPTLATTYGQVRSNTIEFGGTVDPLETAWVVPAAGAAVDFNYVTVSNGGTYSNISAYANGIVGPPAVPEPSTFVMIAVALGVTLVSRIRRAI